MAANIEVLTQLAKVIKEERNTGANTAERIGNMFLAIIDRVGDVDAEAFSKYFLRKDKEDSTAFLLKLLAGAEFGEFVDSLIAGKGAGIFANGRAQFESLEVRGTMKILNLIIQELNLMAGDTSFSDFGTVDSVLQIDATTYQLTMRKRTDVDYTTLAVNDVLYSIVSDILIGGTTHYTSWMRVASKDATANTITVVLYDNAQVPGGENFPPVAEYNITRRGSAVIPTDGTTNERAQSWLISSSEGRMMFLQNVYKPILEDYNYALTIGKIPNISALKNLPIKEGDTGIVAKTIICENLYQFDYNGDVQTKLVERGEWSLETAQSTSPYRFVQNDAIYDDGVHHYTLLEQHIATRNGMRFACLVDKTTQEPKWNSTDWACLEADKTLRLEITSTDGTQFGLDDVSTQLEMHVFYGRQDITSDIIASGAYNGITWTRDSGDTSDASWKASTNVLDNRATITQDDMSDTWATSKKVTFKCEVILHSDGTIFSGDITLYGSAAGADGEDAVYYYLNCSPDVLYRDADGNLDRNVIELKRVKVTGSTEQTSYGIVRYKYKRNGVWGSLEDFYAGSSLTVPSDIEGVEFTMFDSSATRATKTVLVVKEGDSPTVVKLFPSTSSIRQVDGVNTPSSMYCGTVSTGDTVSTLVVGAPSGYTIKYEIDGGDSVVYSSGSFSIATATKYVTIALYKGTTFIDYVLIPVVKNGDTPEIAQLIPTTTQFTKKDGVISPNYFKCGVKFNGITQTIDGVPSGSGYYIKYKLDDASTEYAYTNTIDLTSFSKYLILKLYNSAGNQVDLMTIPMTEDGVDGTGTPGTNGLSIKSIYKRSQGKPSTPSGNAPSGWSEDVDSLSLPDFTYTGAFLQQADGWRISPPTANSAASIDRVSFTTTDDNVTIPLVIKTSTEKNYDKMTISALDSSTVVYTYSGTTAETTLNITVATAGEHYFDIIYTKDSGGTSGDDKVYYKILAYPNTYVSSGYFRDGVLDGSWSTPHLFVTDSASREDIYLLTSENVAPSAPATAQIDDYVPLPWAIDSFGGEFVSKNAQTVGTYYRSGDNYYKCITARTASSSILVTDTAYFTPVQIWTDNPLSVDESWPYQWVCSRKNSLGEWSAFSEPKLYQRLARNGSQGVRGAKYRSRVWASGVDYYCGTTGEEFFDIVNDNGSWYLCKESHTSTTATRPQTDVANNGGKWALETKYDFVATILLLAEKIKAEQIDADGIVAKDAEIEGIIKATLFYSPSTSVSYASSYTINPATGGCEYYSSESPATINLPSAVTYDGLEITWEDYFNARTTHATTFVSSQGFYIAGTGITLTNNYRFDGGFTVKFKARSGKWLINANKTGTFI